LLIEAAVESLDAARAAVEGGAHRLEWCRDLAQGGLTPTLDLPRVSIPVFVLIRPRPGDFAYTAAEHRTMLEQIARAKAAGAHGIVSGALSAGREIDQARVAELIAAARPLPFTFHRAIGACARMSEALETLIDLGVERVLTSGSANTAPEGAREIAELVRQAGERIVIMAGGGITAANVAQLVRQTAVREIHFSVTSAQKVRDIRESL
jgi:copper homeostasis protein